VVVKSSLLKGNYAAIIIAKEKPFVKEK